MLVTEEGEAVGSVSGGCIEGALYEVGQQEAEHALSLNNYHKEGTGDVITSWVLLEEVCE
jgi:xanthine/CO dehydrogenase XdhC/CoxF family maturation factor